MYRLLIRHEDRTWDHRLLEGRTLHLGSSPDNDVRLPVPGVSRRHATVALRPDGLWLSDLGSKNGLILDGRRLSTIRLAPQQVVQVGEAFLSFEEVASSDALLALHLDEASSEIPAALRTASWHAVPPGGGARAVLGFVRTFGRLTPRQITARLPELLTAARQVLEAGGLFLLQLDAGRDLVVVAHDGRLPAAADLAVLEARLPQGPAGRLTVPEQSGGRMELAGLASGRWLGAVLSTPPASDPWDSDFFSYLADLLAGDMASTGGSTVTAAPPAPELRLPPEMVVGGSPAMETLLRSLRNCVGSGLDVLLTGETGTGKELIARLIHDSGPGADRPLIAVNCAAIPADLLEAELFGMVAGAATGVAARKGRFVQAHGGSILLDEVGEMPIAVQAKLLRVLQEREVWPLGAPAPVKIDVRIISSTNRDLEEQVRSGLFRQDLLYRLRVLHYHVPPLRQRREEIPALAEAFIRRAAHRSGKRIRGVSRRALERLISYPWPGNVRQLQAEIQRAVLECPAGGALESKHLSEHLRQGCDPATVASASGASPAPAPSLTFPARPGPLREALDALARQQITSALESAGGNKSQAARILAISRRGLDKMIRRLGLS